jgi:hypothetical protein
MRRTCACIRGGAPAKLACGERSARAVVSTLACTPPGRRAGEACLQMRRALQQGCRGPVLDTSTCQVRKDAKGGNQSVAVICDHQG